jgi:hypothetical protein
VVGVTFHALSLRLAWALVAGLAVIALAVAATGLSARPAPAPHVWHAKLLPFLVRMQPPSIHR